VEVYQSSGTCIGVGYCPCLGGDFNSNYLFEMRAVLEKMQDFGFQKSEGLTKWKAVPRIFGASGEQYEVNQFERRIKMNMTAKRMLGIAGAVVLGAGWVKDREVKAAPQLSYGQAVCTSYVPPAWGKFQGGNQQTGLVFEDTAGTLRFITQVPCESTPSVSLEIRRGKPPNGWGGN